MKNLQIAFSEYNKELNVKASMITFEIFVKLLDRMGYVVKTFKEVKEVRKQSLLVCDAWECIKLAESLPQ